MDVYVLRCRKGKFYIGKTSNLQKRLKEHLKMKNGSKWTKIHKMIALEEVIVNAKKEDEDRVTLEYMKKYGVKNVRGGSYSRVLLTSSEESHLKRMFCTSEDLCYNCNKNGHFSQNCPEIDEKGYYYLEQVDTIYPHKDEFDSVEYKIEEEYVIRHYKRKPCSRARFIFTFYTCKCNSCYKNSIDFSKFKIKDLKLYERYLAIETIDGKYYEIPRKDICSKCKFPSMDISFNSC